MFCTQYFELDAERWKLVRKYTVPPGLRQVRRQNRYFRWRFPDDVVLLRVGRFFEFYDLGETPQLACLGLKPMGWNRRGAQFGFPVRDLDRNLGRLLVQGNTVLLTGEEKNHPAGILRRLPVCRLVPVARTGMIGV